MSARLPTPGARIRLFWGKTRASRRRSFGHSFQPRTDLRVEAGVREGPAVVAQRRRRGIVVGIVEAGHQGLHDPPRSLPEDLLPGQQPQIAQGVDGARGQQVLDAGEPVPGKAVGTGREALQAPGLYLAFVESLPVEGPEQRHRVRRRDQALGPLAAMAQGPLQVALLPRHPVSGDGDVEEAEVLGQLMGVRFAVGHAAGADAVADEGVPRVVVPRRDLRHPVADVLGGIRQQGDGFAIPRLQPDVARQEEQEGFGPVMGLGLRLVPVEAFPLHPALQRRLQRLEVAQDRRVPGDQEVGEPREGVVGLVLAAVVGTGRIEAPALLEPVVHLGPESGVGDVAVVDVVVHPARGSLVAGSQVLD